jgi:hypothetical protein
LCTVYYHTSYQVTLGGVPLQEFAPRYFVITSCRELKSRHWDGIQWYDVYMKFHENGSTGSKSKKGKHKDSHAQKHGNLISLLKKGKEAKNLIHVWATERSEFESR